MFGRRKNRHNSANTIVGIDTRVNGDMHFTGGLHVDGIVHGNVSADPDSESSLSLADGATVDGGVTVPYVLLEGMVKGDVFANKRVILGSSARIIGNVYYNLIEMAIGAEINGKLVHQPEGQVPLLEQTAKIDESAAVPSEA
ncbi:MAG: polymer-forming cytoskeletal protein [Gammaproteobacteria bacterium]|nr:polymer-forming cytoskeletal protein [Gammaproteobacteria bacterium]